MNSARKERLQEIQEGLLETRGRCKAKFLEEAGGVGDSLPISPPTYQRWETDFYPVLALGGFSSQEGAKHQHNTGQKSCTHGARDFIQCWGWGLEQGSWRMSRCLSAKKPLGWLKVSAACLWHFCCFGCPQPFCKKGLSSSPRIPSTCGKHGELSGEAKVTGDR